MEIISNDVELIMYAKFQFAGDRIHKEKVSLSEYTKYSLLILITL